MSEVATATPTQRGGRPAGCEPAPSCGARRGDCSLVVVLLLVLPLYVDEFWLRTGFAVCAAVIGAVGLNLLVGTTGLLSLGHAFFLAVGAITYVYVAGEEGGTATQISGLGWPPLGRNAPGCPHGGAVRSALQPHRRTAARHLPRCRLARTRLHRAARAEHVDLGDRWLQRPRHPGVLDLRLPLRLRQPRVHGPGRPLRAGRAALVPRAGPGRSHDLVRPEPAAQPPRSCAADPARQRGRRRGDGRQRPGLQGARLPGLLDARRAVGRALRAVHRSGGAGELLVAAVRAVPRHDRPGRSGLGVGRRCRRRVRERAAPGVPGVRRLVALHRRARLARDRGEPGGRLPLRPRDRPRGALRARRTRRPRPTSSQRVPPQFRGTPTPPHASRSAHNPKRSPTHENRSTRV